MSLKLPNPLKFRYYFLAVPVSDTPFPVGLLRYRAADILSCDLLCPHREADVHKFDQEEDREPILLEGWSRIDRILHVVAAGGWRFVPLTSDETYRVDDSHFREQVCAPNYWSPGVNGEKDKRSYLHFAKASPAHRISVYLPYNCLRYDKAAFLSDLPTTRLGTRNTDDQHDFYFVHPAESRQDKHSWHPGHWQSYQWSLEPLNFSDLPEDMRERVL